MEKTTGFASFTPFTQKVNSPENIAEYFANVQQNTGINLLQDNSNPFMNNYLGIKPQENVSVVSSDKTPKKSITDWLKEAGNDLSTPTPKYNPFENYKVQYANIPATKSKKEFITKYGAEFEKLSKKTGINKDLLMAQVGLETGWGAHSPGNNIGGIKATKSWTGATQTLKTKEQGKNGLIEVMQTFRKYTTPAEGFEDYANFLIKNKRYDVVKGITDPMKAAEVMASTGYATDKNYKQKLQSIIKQLHTS